MSTKIFWTKDEQEAVFNEMVRLFQANPLLRKEQALEAAQSVLEYERRRKIHSSVVYRYKDLIDRTRAEAKKQRAAPPPPVVEPDPLGVILDQIIGLLADKIIERIGIQPTESGAAVSIRVKHNPEPISAPRIGRIGVLVIGLLNQQAQTIIRSFPHLEFTCLTPEEALKRDPLRRSYTILMTKFINHSVQDKYRKAPNLRLCNGGVSELSAMLKSIS